MGFVGAIGATPGKLMLGLRIVAQEDGHTPPHRVGDGDRGAVAGLALDRRPPSHRLRPRRHDLRGQALDAVRACAATGLYAGGPVLGDVEAGVVGGLISVPFAIVSGGLACVAAAAGFALFGPRLAHYEPSAATVAEP